MASEGLLSIAEAARRLGYTVDGLRKIVDRSRSRRAGANTHGPTIKFFQASPHSSIKFRPEWIDEFIDQHTCDPSKGVTMPNATNRKPATKPKSAVESLEVMGFKKSLYNI